MRTITSSIKVYGTAAERAAMRDSDIPDNQEITFVEDDTGNIYFWDGDSWTQISTNGATHVRPMPGPQTVSKNRELTAVSTRQSCTWTDSENVTEVTILIVSDAGTAALDDGAFVCFDATSDALADQWLLEGSYTNSASNRYFIPLNVPRTFRFTSNITRADFKVNGDGGSTAFHVIVEAN